jgi:hypothetical protein
LRDIYVYRSPLARLASDHLPLVGNLDWGTLEPRRREPPRVLRRRARPSVN